PNAQRNLIDPGETATIQTILNAGADTVYVQPRIYPATPVVTRGVCIIGGGLVSQRPLIDGLTLRPDYDPTIVPAFACKALQITSSITIDNGFEPCSIEFASCQLLGGISDISEYIETRDLRLLSCG